RRRGRAPRVGRGAPGIAAGGGAAGAGRGSGARHHQCSAREGLRGRGRFRSLPGMGAVREALRRDASVVSFQSLALPFPLGRRYYKIQARSGVSDEGAGRVWRAWWHYLPGTGNVADHYGWWVLVPYGEGRTLGTCLLYTDPGRGMPAWAVHRGTAETMPY